MTAHWRNFGQGPRNCVALHCSLAHSGAWRGVADTLGAAVSVQAIDFPGHGKASGPPDALDHVEQAIAAAATALDEPVDVIAHSFGAYVALRLAMIHPEKIKTLSLYEPVYMASVKETHPELHQRNFLEMQHIADLIAEGDRPQAARLFMDVWGDGRNWQEHEAEAQHYFAERITQPCRIQPWVSEDVTNSLPALENIQVPVLLMDGENSPSIMAAVQNNLAQRLPNAVRATVPEARHMGIVSHPQPCAALIAQHIGLA